MSPPRMSLHIGDYKKDTGHLRAAGHGAYFLLMMHYWANGELPSDDDQLAAIACMTDKEWKKHKPTLKAFFKAPGEWRHKRIDDELEKAAKSYQALSDAGKAGNEKRWSSRRPRDGIATRSPPDREAMPSGSQPITYNQSDDDGGHARASGANTSEQAFSIATAVANICGFTDPLAWPPGWCGAPMRVQAWLNAKWPQEIIIAACREAMAKKRDGPPESIAYFEKPIAKAVSRQSAPLPKVVTIEAETIHVQADQRNGHSYRDAQDRGRAAIAEFTAAVDELERRGGGEGGQGVGEVLPVDRGE